MKRRDFIRTAALSSSLLMMPNLVFSLAKRKNPEIVVIGNSDHRYAIDFFRQNGISGFTSIGWDETHLHDFSNINNIPFDFSSINVNRTQPLKNRVFIPQRVQAIFKPDNNYLILCSLYREESVLSKEIINSLQRNKIKYWFLGVIPFLNPGLGQWVTQLIPKGFNNQRVFVFDLEERFNILRKENGDILFSDGVKKLDEDVLRAMNNLYKGLIL